MTDGVNACMHLVKPPGPQSMLDRVPTEAAVMQLSPGTTPC